MGESRSEQLDRNFDELLQELRVAQTGTQILFAFLLTIAYTRPFRDADAFVHVAYAVTLVLAGLAAALLIAPVAMHRTLFRRGRKDDLVRIGGRLALTGLYVLMAAVGGSVLLALDVALGRVPATVVTAGLLVVVLVLWVVIPVVLRHRRPGGPGGTADRAAASRDAGG
jgi:hypothetical protein